MNTIDLSFQFGNPMDYNFQVSLQNNIGCLQKLHKVLHGFRHHESHHISRFQEANQITIESTSEVAMPLA